MQGGGKFSREGCRELVSGPCTDTCSCPGTLPSVIRSTPELRLVPVPSSLAFLTSANALYWSLHGTSSRVQLPALDEGRMAEAPDNRVVTVFNVHWFKLHVNIHIWLLTAHTQALL